MKQFWDMANYEIKKEKRIGKQRIEWNEGDKVITHLVQTIYVGYDIASIPLDLRCFFGSETKFIIEASGNKYFIDPDDLGGIIDFLTLCKNTRKQWEEREAYEIRG